MGLSPSLPGVSSMLGDGGGALLLAASLGFFCPHPHSTTSQQLGSTSEVALASLAAGPVSALPRASFSPCS